VIDSAKLMSRIEDVLRDAVMGERQRCLDAAKARCTCGQPAPEPVCQACRIVASIVSDAASTEERRPFSGCRRCLQCGALAGKDKEHQRGELVDGWWTSWCSGKCSEAWFAANPSPRCCRVCTFVHGVSEEECVDIRRVIGRGPGS
jgi:hypothetical protein